ncbi:MFS transporter [Streptomyces sp. NY05-11A]|uniref:MFS transporter n=1 Tax=Streptomyces soliscabiei TaxID=588897 RepID=UPI0029BB6727|nr:MFS transporter [Streptomyces sp. NY05-11A]MDX2679985.1 MFS transporter [Streptomyces sp. NY05-11A]
MRDLPANARYCVLLEPMWALTGTIVLYYATLYMKSTGLSTLSIGVIMSAGLYAAFFFQLIAGAVTDRLGRRRATLIFDLTSWVLPMFLWAFSHDFWTFLIAYLLSATSKIVNVSFNLLATEDTPGEQRARVFAAIKLIIMAAGLLTPVAGGLMTHYGTVATLRVVYLLGGVTMLIHFVWRHRMTTETAAGRAAMRRHQSIGITRSVVDSFRRFGVSIRTRRMWPIVGIYVLTNLAVQINLFQVIYLDDVLRFSTATISYLPALSAALALVCYLVVMPRLRGRQAVTITLVTLVVSSLGWAMFLAVPAHGMTLLIVSTGLTGAGLFLLESYRDALLVNELHDQERAAMLSAVQTVTAVVAIPSGYVAALLYEQDPRLPFTVILGCYSLSAVLALILGRTPEPAGAQHVPRPAKAASEV